MVVVHSPYASPLIPARKLYCTSSRRLTNIVFYPETMSTTMVFFPAVFNSQEEREPTLQLVVKLNGQEIKGLEYIREQWSKKAAREASGNRQQLAGSEHRHTMARLLLRGLCPARKRWPFGFDKFSLLLTK